MILALGFLWALSLLEGGLAAPWLVSPFPWTIPFQHLAVHLLQYSFFFFLIFFELLKLF